MKVVSQMRNLVLQDCDYIADPADSIDRLRDSRSFCIDFVYNMELIKCLLDAPLV